MDVAYSTRETGADMDLQIATLQRGRLLRQDSNRIRISGMPLSRMQVPTVPRCKDADERKDAGRTLRTDADEDRAVKACSL